MNIYDELHHKNISLKSDPFIRVPAVPSLGMVISASETANVFRPGDTVLDSLKPLEEITDGEEYYVDDALVARFGERKAFALACIADLYTICIYGIEKWFDTRRRHSMYNSEGKDLVSYSISTCPPMGWESVKGMSDQDAKAYYTCEVEPFPPLTNAYYYPDQWNTRMAPRKLPFYAASSVMTEPLTTTILLEVDDVLDRSRIPRIPHWSKDGPYTEDETPCILLAAIWKGAMSWLLSENRADPMEFPMHPKSQMIAVSNFAMSAVSLMEKGQGFFTHFPYRAFELENDGAILKAGARDDGKVDVSFCDGKTGETVALSGITLRAGYSRYDLDRLRYRIKDDNAIFRGVAYKP